MDPEDDPEGLDQLETVEVPDTPQTSTSGIAANGSTNQKSNSVIDVSGNGATNHNYPVIIKQYTCPTTETEKVLLVAALPGGAQNLQVELHEDGIGVSIKYSWPKVMYNVSDLFRKKLEIEGYHEYHPMILCYKNGLEQFRKRIDVPPAGLIKVALPVRVQTAIGSWEKWGAKREDGSQVVLASFSCFVKDYVKKVADESVVFD